MPSDGENQMPGWAKRLLEFSRVPHIAFFAALFIYFIAPNQLTFTLATVIGLGVIAARIPAGIWILILFIRNAGDP